MQATCTAVCNVKQNKTKNEQRRSKNALITSMKGIKAKNVCSKKLPGMCGHLICCFTVRILSWFQNLSMFIVAVLLKEK